MRPSVTILAFALVLAGAVQAGAEPPAAATGGHPDLSGVWTNASLTRLTRPPGVTKLVVSEAEAAAIAKANPLSQEAAAEARETAPADKPPPEGDPAGYNTFWMDFGTSLGLVNGQRRTSWIVDPADGQLPFSPAGRKLVAASHAAHQADAPAGPEDLMPWDRCIIGSRNSGGPGMLNNIYNSNYEIVQSPRAVAIEVEMIHDVRVIPLFPTKAAAQAAHGPAALHPWLGDSVGWWEGGTLVVETVHVNPEQGRSGPIFLSPQARVTERLTRIARGQILYDFTVDDPAYYTRPWRAELRSQAALRIRLP